MLTVPPDDELEAPARATRAFSVAVAGLLIASVPEAALCGPKFAQSLAAPWVDARAGRIDTDAPAPVSTGEVDAKTWAQRTGDVISHYDFGVRATNAAKYHVKADPPKKRAVAEEDVALLKKELDKAPSRRFRIGRGGERVRGRCECGSHPAGGRGRALAQAGRRGKSASIIKRGKGRGRRGSGVRGAGLGALRGDARRLRGTSVAVATAIIICALRRGGRRRRVGRRGGRRDGGGRGRRFSCGRHVAGFVPDLGQAG